MDTFDDIEDFLSLYPDPHDTFDETYDRTDYEGNAEIYLKARYEGVSSYVIKDLINNHKYNLIDICEKLDGRGSKATPFDPDKVELLPSATERFHHEVWYVEHRSEIEEVLELAADLLEEYERQQRDYDDDNDGDEDFNIPKELIFKCGKCSVKNTLSDIVEDSPDFNCKNCRKRLFMIGVIFYGRSTQEEYTSENGESENSATSSE
ncbi:hypothetical protein J6590_092739 [Homalodisca vitripennis]|nr:hypothetical protein J6590_092739 [Homalodisca vitripennis]